MVICSPIAPLLHVYFWMVWLEAGSTFAFNTFVSPTQTESVLYSSMIAGALSMLTLTESMFLQSAPLV